MVNENIIPKTETIYEIKSEIPSFEEFMKTYQTDEANEFLAEAEYQDKALHGPQYGPGGSNSKDAAKGAMSVLLAVSYAVPPLAPVGIAVSVGVGVTGVAMEKLSDDPEVKEAGRDLIGIVAGSVEHRDAVRDGVNTARAYNQLRK
jgi:hypothetical protein